MNSSKRIILHIDFDSFFASVEQQYNPFFRNKPLGVTATNGRTCIIASSREAKKLGIKTGTRTFDAFRIYPDLQLTPADFWKYWEISKKFISICSGFSPLVEVFSIDELFMDITYTAKLYGGVMPLIDKLKEQIRDEIGEYITVSIGVSHNKLLAKLASGLKKPNGIFVIHPSQIEHVYKVVDLIDICGIGERIKKRLNGMGIFTLTQLRRTPRVALIAEFGHVEGRFLYDVGQGVDVNPVQAFTQDTGVKSVGRQHCLARNEHNSRIVLQNVYELFEEVAFKLRRLHKKARSGGLILYGSYIIHGHVTQQAYVDSGRDLFQLGMQVIHRQYNQLPPGYVRRIGVWAGYLQDSGNLPLPLLPYDQKQEKVLKAMDSLNERFGDHTIRNGFLVYSDKLTTVPNGYMADRYERRKLAHQNLEIP